MRLVNTKLCGMELKTYLSNLQRGGISKLANALGISSSYLSQLSSGLAPISLERCIEIEKATGGAVRCEELRPDVDWAYLRKSNSEEAA